MKTTGHKRPTKGVSSSLKALNNHVEEASKIDQVLTVYHQYMSQATTKIVRFKNGIALSLAAARKEVLETNNGSLLFWLTMLIAVITIAF